MMIYIDYETQKAYKEVNQILDIMGDEYKNKINKNLLTALKEKEAKDYQTRINPNISFLEQKISRKAISILAVLNMKYWIDDENEKDRLLKLYDENYKNYEKKCNDIFKKSEKESSKENYSKTTNMELLPIEQSFFGKVKLFFRNIFKNFRK